MDTQWASPCLSLELVSIFLSGYPDTQWANPSLRGTLGVAQYGPNTAFPRQKLANTEIPRSKTVKSCTEIEIDVLHFLPHVQLLCTHGLPLSVQETTVKRIALVKRDPAPR